MEAVSEDQTDLTEEQAQEEKDKLDRAIRDYWKAVQPEMFIDDWVLAVHKDSVAMSAEGVSQISCLTPTGQPFHRTQGLLMIAMEGGDD